MKLYKSPFAFGLYSMALISATGCKKFLTIPLPVNNVSGNAPFLSDLSAGASSTGNYVLLVTDGTVTGGEALSYRTAEYADDLTNLATNNTQNQAFYTDNLVSGNTNHWNLLYKNIYGINTTLEGLQAATVNMDNKNQWLGESYFLRAFDYFNITNLYGDCPLALTSDYKTNNVLKRAPQSDVYKQIIADLKQAISLLPEEYRDGYGSSTTSRTRPNKYAAFALLSRAYLYTGDWKNAEAAADSILSLTDNYQLTTPDKTFLASSLETVWSLPYVKVVGSAYSVIYDYVQYNNGMPATLNGTAASAYAPACMSPTLLNSFESGDLRYTSWVRQVTETVSGNTNIYYYPNKYQSNVVNTENSMQIRLAEVYLIRAEARAKQNNISGAQADINAIRHRAGLGNTTASTQATLLNAVMQERRVELFTESGLRFFDLKRTNTIDDVMSVVAPQKGGKWNADNQLWPIRSSDIIANPNLTQNPGYSL